MRISEQMVYLTDNGAAYCGAHLGACAKATGRDISGQEIMPITPDVIAESDRSGYPVPSCEECGHKASRLYVRA